MGRKIPAKKHRGVKDPIKQQEQRLKSLKGKINAAPRDPDEQPVPRSLLRLFGLPEPAPAAARARAAPRGTRRALPTLPALPAAGSKSKSTPRAEQEKKRNPVAGLRRLPGEDGRSFSLRINSALRTLHDAHDVTEYPSARDEEAEDVKGAAMSERRERRARKRARRGAAGAGAGAAGPAPAHHLTLKKKAKKEKLQEEQSARRAELVYERVAFGDVAAAPPALPPPRRATAPAGGARPGQRALLLHAVLAGAAPAPAPAPAPRSPRSPRPAAPPPPAELARRERARLQAVAAYRALKRRPAAPPPVPL